MENNLFRWLGTGRGMLMSIAATVGAFMVVANALEASDKWDWWVATHGWVKSHVEESWLPMSTAQDGKINQLRLDLQKVSDESTRAFQVLTEQVIESKKTALEGELRATNRDINQYKALPPNNPTVLDRLGDLESDKAAIQKELFDTRCILNKAKGFATVGC